MKCFLSAFVTKLVLLGLFAFFSTSALQAAGDIWAGTLGYVTPDGGQGGYWYSYTDEGDGGSSTIVPDLSLAINAEDLGEEGSLVVAMTLGESIDYPYVVMGFNWVDAAQGSEEPYDISAHSSICFTYKTDKSINVELKEPGNPGDNNDARTVLAISSSKKMVNVALADFEQEPNWGTAYTPNLSTQLGLTFKYKGNLSAHGSTANFQLYEVGFDGSCSSGNSSVGPLFAGPNEEKVIVTQGHNLLLPEWIVLSETSVKIFDVTGSAIPLSDYTLSGNRLALSKINPGLYFFKAGSYLQKLQLW